MSDTTSAPHSWQTIYLGLGGNISNELGDPVSHVLSVADSLGRHADFADVRLSSLYRSKPFGVLDQPDFVNAVLSARTRLSPIALLDFCQNLEQAAGRVRLRHWGERSLDVDILLYGDTMMDSERLSIPHKGLFERSFVIIPLLELQPDMTVNGVPLSSLSLAKDETLLKLN
ncbi:MAG: 2-amino-4-hydroxy-6-hydroxymethyldihydropteridine diphosphokinase [Moraxella sp.]|nr:2-amino-4-hydroxy-6-hydroxymethyldihydropteridine diphosphokinase [Moraxella sp.]